MSSHERCFITRRIQILFSIFDHLVNYPLHFERGSATVTSQIFFVEFWMKNLGNRIGSPTLCHGSIHIEFGQPGTVDSHAAEIPWYVVRVRGWRRCIECLLWILPWMVFAAPPLFRCFSSFCLKQVCLSMVGPIPNSAAYSHYSREALNSWIIVREYSSERYEWRQLKVLSLHPSPVKICYGAPQYE